MSRPRKSDDTMVQALAHGKSHAEAARIADVSESTITRRLREPEFAARVDEERAQVTSAAAEQLAGLYPKAIATLGDLLDDRDGRLRLGAAQLVFKSGLVFREHSELEERLRVLEGTGG